MYIYIYIYGGSGWKRGVYNLENCGGGVSGEIEIVSHFS